MSASGPEPLDLPLLLSLYGEHAGALRKVRADESALYRRYRGPEASRSTLSAPSGAFSPARRKWISDHVPLSVLIQLRRILKAVFPGRDLDPQADDLDNEITYLLIRHFRPRTVVEIAPCGGWSTTWILSALRDAGQGHLYSYDLIDDSTRTVPPELSEGRWTFRKGNVRKLLNSLPSPIDHLFLDADHSAPFAQWYLENLFPRVSPGAVVSVDDIFHPQLEERGEVGEIRTVLNYLRAREVGFFTAAPSAQEGNYRALLARKAELGMGELIHDSTINPTIFLRAPMGGFTSAPHPTTAIP